MTTGAGLVLTATGAVLAFAVDATHSHGFNINTIGYILMIIGILGIALDLMLFMPRRRATYASRGVRVTRVDETL